MVCLSICQFATFGGKRHSQWRCLRSSYGNPSGGLQVRYPSLKNSSAALQALVQQLNRRQAREAKRSRRQVVPKSCILIWMDDEVSDAFQVVQNCHGAQTQAYLVEIGYLQVSGLIYCK